MKAATPRGGDDYRACPMWVLLSLLVLLREGIAQGDASGNRPARSPLRVRALRTDVGALARSVVRIGSIGSWEMRRQAMREAVA